MTEALTIKVRRSTINRATGERVEELVPMTVHVAKPEPGQCPMCNRAHDPGEPHDAMNVAYQYRFHAAEGRFPTWRDAMAHCAPGVRAEWVIALSAHGVSVEKLRDPEDES